MSADLLPVTEADRQAAADYLKDHGYWHVDPEAYIAGKMDGVPLVQAFARHRLASSGAAGSGEEQARKIAREVCERRNLKRDWFRAMQDFAADPAARTLAPPTTEERLPGADERLRKAAQAVEMAAPDEMAERPIDILLRTLSPSEGGEHDRP